MDAIIGAGGHIRPNDPLAELLPEGKTKALLPIAGKPMIQWTLDAIVKYSIMSTTAVGDAAGLYPPPINPRVADPQAPPILIPPCAKLPKSIAFP